MSSSVSRARASSSSWNRSFKARYDTRPCRWRSSRTWTKRASKSITAPHLGQRCLCLGQPEGHLHGAVQRDGGGQFAARLFPSSYLAIEHAEAEVAVCHERAHAEFVGQG